MKGLRYIQLKSRIKLTREYESLRFSSTLNSLIENYSAICFENFFNKYELELMLEKLYELRSDWSLGFDGEQYSLGEVYYHYTETGAEKEYWSRAQNGRNIINSYFPNLYKEIIELIKQLQSGDKVELRQNWSGPSIIIFPAGEHCSTHGGGSHYDWDGLTKKQLLDPTVKAYSFVCMLQKPEKGGELRLWERYFASEDDNYDDLRNNDIGSILIDYQPGDLWMFRSLQAHGIQPFSGNIDRVCLTFHTIFENGVWNIWV